jgi:hypothetical protein
MNLFLFRKDRAAVTAALPRLARADRPRAVWVREPRTGRLVQTWTSGDEEDGSSTERRQPSPFSLRAAA